MNANILLLVADLRPVDAGAVERGGGPLDWYDFLSGGIDAQSVDGEESDDKVKPARAGVSKLLRCTSSSKTDLQHIVDASHTLRVRLQLVSSSQKVVTQLEGSLISGTEIRWELGDGARAFAGSIWLR